MIKMAARTGKVDQKFIDFHDYNITHEHHDKDGQTVNRWVREPLEKYQPVRECCNGIAQAKNKHIIKHEDELTYVKKLDRYEKLLYKNIEVRQRAIKGWKKIHFMLIVLKLVNKRAKPSYSMSKSDTSMISIDEEKKKLSCRELLAPKMLHPKSRMVKIW